jgi:hypothetical protein
MPGLCDITPNAVYTEGSVCLMLGVTLAALAQARREGRLRYTRAGRQVLILGEHILDWLGGSSAAERRAVTNA